MVESDKRQLGDGSDSFSNAASNLSRDVNTMRQQASASSAGAAAAGAAKTGKAIAGAAKGAAAAGPWGALAAAAWSARHTLYKILICTALFFTFIIVMIVSLPSIVTNGIFGLNGTKPVEGATLTDTYSEMAKAVSSVVDYGYELSLARVDRLIEEGGCDYKLSMDSLINYGHSSAGYDTCYTELLYGIEPSEKSNVFLAILGLTTEDRYKPADETAGGQPMYYYQSDKLISGLQKVLADNSTAVKNALEQYIHTCGGTALAETDAYGHTAADNLPLGLYLLVETRVPESVIDMTDPFLVSLPMTAVNGSNAENGGDAWLYDVTLYPKNLTGIPSLEKTLREARIDTGKNHGSTSDIADGYAHTATASGGDLIDYQIISTLPSITSQASYLSEYTFVDTLSKGISYKKNDVLIEFFKDANCTDHICSWDENSGKFTVAYNTGADGKNVMTISMTAAGLADINSSSAVYTGADMVNSGYSDCTMRITYQAKLNSDNTVSYGDTGNSNAVALQRTLSIMRKKIITRLFRWSP
ncbi:MAG: SpaH/EbpB family LPXTG-anchored major pilin [Oscillospiraceae bacterium]|nr:SpaH/EbpB family LPXTG-anchored major pilin [Oscillospiraceae bacterium]